MVIPLWWITTITTRNQLFEVVREMNFIAEFTGVAGIPPVGDVGKGMPTGQRRFRRKKRIIDSFIGEPATLSESPGGSPGGSPGVKITEFPDNTLPVPTPVTVPPVVESLPKALMISKEVVEALMAGHSVNVRGIILEPTFEAINRSTPINVESPASAADAVQRATNLVESVSGGYVDMNAPQPPPVPTTNGKAVSTAFRRFGGATIS